ncbi:hypothetical protein UFOVP45_88 [uncultured Caudovirales phage]|uniref:Uncharacterized protein n=1 Tax=uncultured Caudovirales phage TaxID=2100421 RepID=A0A6J5KSG1_9CAUD|nr:hypothetical protein UFOVP45_88 [uncultured Caudovirales phage]
MLNPVQFFGQMKQRKAAVVGLKTAAQSNGYNNAWHNNAGTTESPHSDPFVTKGPFSAPSSSEHLQEATSNAKKAGISDKKISKTVSKAKNIGASYGQEHSAFGAAGKNPFRGM